MVTARMGIYLLALSPLHVGGDEGRFGYEETIVVRRTYRNYVPYVPGSTVKGVLRTAACYVAKLVGATCCWAKEPTEIVDRHSKMGMPCDVCRIWGYPGHRGMLSVTDFVLVDGIPTTMLRLTHIEIDDYTGRAKEGALYVMDYVPAGTLFRGMLELEMERPVDLTLVLSSMYILEYVGMGRGGIVRAYLESLEFRDIGKKKLEVKDENDLRKALTQAYGSVSEVELTVKLYRELHLPPEPELDLLKELSAPRVWRW
ncbi:MAG: hypothetical protein GXO32_06370 [Crenarchaeota archaeon]|nr:hypothetical protein [Thermoproteota archaeon]